MNCNIDLHNELKETGEICCPFCDKKLQDCIVKHDLCCDCQDLFHDDGLCVCKTCGKVNGYDLSNNYVYFYDDMYKIKRKSVYHRKYHKENVIMDICTANKINISMSAKNRICRVFNEIEKNYSSSEC